MFFNHVYKHFIFFWTKTRFQDNVLFLFFLVFITSILSSRLSTVSDTCSSIIYLNQWIISEDIAKSLRGCFFDAQCMFSVTVCMVIHYLQFDSMCSKYPPSHYTCFKSCTPLVSRMASCVDDTKVVDHCWVPSNAFSRRCRQISHWRQITSASLLGNNK